MYCTFVYLNYIYLIVYIANDSGDMEIKRNFSSYKDVSNAFAALFAMCQKAIKVSSEEFKTIRNSCV